MSSLTQHFSKRSACLSKCAADYVAEKVVDASSLSRHAAVGPNRNSLYTQNFATFLSVTACCFRKAPGKPNVGV